jgi:translation elongation factor EF-1alpha
MNEVSKSQFEYFESEKTPNKNENIFYFSFLNTKTKKKRENHISHLTPHTSHPLLHLNDED